MIPGIAIDPLFGPGCPARDACDAAILQAATGIGFMQITGAPALMPVADTERRRLLRIFDLPQSSRRRLFRRSFAPENANVYRGWFPLQPGFATYKEGIDLGPDIGADGEPPQSADPLQEPTPLPPERELPGWRADAARYHAAMQTLGRMVMRSVARGLGLPETWFDAAFADGISTLRLIHYQQRPEAASPDDAWVVQDGIRRRLAGAAHVDSGFVTLLAQDGVSGLQAERVEGGWVDVPPTEGALAVNFGLLLERWTGGRVRATRHRVLGGASARHSIPFFYEPRADARIAPLPGGADFEPFFYGDHLWTSMMRFVEFNGMEALRPQRVHHDA